MKAGLIFNERRHTYHLDGVRLPGVTSILGILAKPELLAWYGRLGLVEANRQRDEAAAFGTRVHTLCEQIANGWPLGVTPDADMVPFGTAFADWIGANVHRVIAAEPRVASRIHGVAGSIDLVAEMVDGQNAILDLKTGSTVPDTTPLQCAAYGRLLLEQDGIQTSRRIAVHLPRKSPGVLNVIEYPQEEEPDSWRAFLCCLILYRRFMAKGRM